jgi:hypothetical protein
LHLDSLSIDLSPHQWLSGGQGLACRAHSNLQNIARLQVSCQLLGARKRIQPALVTSATRGSILAATILTSVKTQDA